jgi:parallel beta-helix repeat protein
MLTKHHTIIVSLLIILSIAVPAAAAPVAAASISYYVSTSGDDDNNGLSESAPFATIEKVNSVELQPGDRVLFKCGDEWDGTMLTITRSGSAGLPITFGSYPAGCANQPVLSGSLPISGWTATATANIYSASLSGGSNAGKFPHGINQLFRSGTRLTMGRWPNLDDAAFDQGYSTIESQNGSTQISDNQLPAANWSGAVAHIRGMRWYILNRQISSSSSQTLNVNSALDCWGGCTGWGYFLNNSLATLDQEGEWYYSTSDHRVYLYTTTGTPAQIEGSAILEADDRFWGGITLGENLTGQGIAYVTVENLSLLRWFRDGIALPTNFAHYEPHDLILQNNTIQDVDSTGIRLMTWVYDSYDGRPDGWRGGYNLTVSGNTIERANRMGIDLQSRNSTFSNNIVQDIGIIRNLGAAGLGCALDDGGGMCTEDGDGIRVKVNKADDTGNNNTFSGNRLERIAYNGMDIFGHHNTVIHNVIQEACYTKGDCGGVRTFGRDSLSASAVHDLTFSENILADIPGNTDGCKDEYKSLFGFGLYIDNYSRDITISGNTITNATVAGILIQNSTASITDNTLYNNASGTMYTGQVVITDSPAYVSTLSGNILFSLQTISWSLNAAGKDRLGTSNNNYFFNPYLANHIAVEGYRTLAQWKTFSGQDANSHENWFSLAPGTPPNSSLFTNATNQTRTISLGTAMYKDLDQNPVYGSLTLAPYHSKVLVRTGDLPDLALSMVATGTTGTAPNGPVSYQLTVENKGAASASGIVLTHLLPATITGTAWAASTGGVTLQTSTHYVWNLPDLSAGGSLTITVTGQYAGSVTAGQPIGLYATVTTITPEAITGNNQAALLLGTWQKVFLPLVSR